MDIHFALITVLILVLLFFIYHLYLDRQETVVASDPQNFDRYGNITERDVDTMLQRNYVPTKNAQIDNSGVIDRALQGYITEHTPNGPGVSPSSSATMTNMYLGEPREAEFMREAYDVRAIDADEALSRKQQHRSDINRKAIDGKVRSTKNVYEKFFSDELDQNEKRVWWSAESDDHETDFDLS